MCGIAGLINIGDKNILQDMINIISHRGPDDAGVKWFDNVNSGLGHRRLSIIDLSSAGHQPMSTDDERYCITYNGEIYNYKEIRRELLSKGYQFKSDCDTEVLIKSYQEWGKRCLEKFNGMFAFAILDIRENKLFAAVDRLGIKPFYYTQKNSSLVFASEIKAILETKIVNKEPDYFALHTPTRYQIAPYTGFKNIFKLPPGNYLEYDGSDLKTGKYWDITPSEKVINESTAIEKLDYLLNDSVRLQMVADVPVGILLSGGLDSSIITALMRKNSNGEIHSFTIKFREEDNKFEKAADDCKYARIVAEKFGLLNKEILIEPDIVELVEKIVWHLDEPLSDPAAINTYLISKAAKDEGIPVLLNGMGGDEVFGGYRKHLACLKADSYQKIFPGFLRSLTEKSVNIIPLATRTQGLRNLRWLKRFLSFASMPRYERFLVSDLSMSDRQFNGVFNNKFNYKDTYYYLSQSKYYENKSLSYLTQMCLNDSSVFLPAHNLLYSDKASMAISIECRPPLIDHRIVEFMFTLPPEFRIKGNNQKWLLKEVSRNYLPSEIVNRPKAPFGSPLRSWIKGQLREMVDDYLSEESINRRGFYNYKAVRDIIKNDRNGIEDNAHIIWTLLCNEIWFRKFFG